MPGGCIVRKSFEIDVTILSAVPVLSAVTIVVTVPIFGAVTVLSSVPILSAVTEICCCYVFQPSVVCLPQQVICSNVKGQSIPKPPDAELLQTVIFFDEVPISAVSGNIG